MIKRILIVSLLVSINFTGYSQDNTLQLYKESIKNCLSEIRINRPDTIYIIVEEGFISQTLIVGEVTLKPANASFFDNLKGDTAFGILKLFPIKIIKEDLMINISHYNFKQRKDDREMIYTGSYYTYFRFDCKNKKYILYKTIKKVL